MGEVFIYKDNTGGSNLRSNEMNINQERQRTEMVYIQNMEIYRRGGFQAQKGNRQRNTTSDATAILGIGQYRTASGVKAIYTKASGKCYVMDLTTGAETEIKSGLSTSAIPEFVNYNGRVGVFNGVDTPFFYDGSTTPAPDVSTPPAGWSSDKPHTVCNVRAGRILAAAGSTLYWNKQGDQNDWTASSDAGSVTDIYTDVAEITAVETYGQSASVHTASNRIYILTGDGSTASPYAVQPMASNKSATGKMAVATVNDSQYFFSGDSILPVVTTDLGVIRLGKDIDLADKIHPFLSGTEDDLIINPIDRDALGDVILLPYDAKNELIGYFKSANSGTTAYDIAAIYSFDTMSWVFRKATPVTAAGIVNGMLFTGTSDGKILEEFYGDAIVGGGTYQKRALSPYFDFGAPHLKKRIQRMWIWMKASGDVSITLNFQVNYNPDIVLQREVSLADDSDSAAYDVGAYDVNTYSTVSVVDDDFPLNLTAKCFQFDMFSNSSTQDFRVLGYGFEVEYLDGY